MVRRRADLFGLKILGLLIVHAPCDLEPFGGPSIELLQRQLQGHLHCAWRPLLAPSKPAAVRQLRDTTSEYHICALFRRVSDRSCPQAQTELLYKG